MFQKYEIPAPLLFNPLKHHLGFIKKYIYDILDGNKQLDNLSVITDLRHLGGSLMDVYTGTLAADDVLGEIQLFLRQNDLSEKKTFINWTGKDTKDFKTIILSDDSQWILKQFNHKLRYIHTFPARYSPHSFRVKANTLKSAILYIICIGKDYVSEEDLNVARAIAGLSPIKDVMDSESITEMIEILRG